MKLLARALLICLCVVSVPAHAVIDKTKSIGAIGIGAIQLSQGATWLDLTATDFHPQTAGYTPAAGDYFVSLSVLNTHATQSLFITLQPGGVLATAVTIEVQPANGWVNLSHLLGTNNRQHVTTISVQGAGAGTTGQIIAYFHRGAP